MTKETGTLKELNVQPGDVVVCVCEGPLSKIGKEYVVNDRGGIKNYCKDNMSMSRFRIVSRAKPKALRDMTWEEAEPIYQAWHRGDTLEYWRLDGRWFENSVAGLHPEMPYRLKPKHVPTFAHWDALPDWVRYLTKSKEGCLLGHLTKPVAQCNNWDSEGVIWYGTNLKGFDWGDLPWDECIIERPKDN